VRENLRRYKAMPIEELLDRSINETLARTLMTALTTLTALLPLWLLGGAVVRDFTVIMIWGVIVGCYSTIYVATPVLYYFNIRAAKPAAETAPGSTPRARPS
jgi:preprotein translocase SecF subunit